MPLTLPDTAEADQPCRGTPQHRLLHLSCHASKQAVFCHSYRRGALSTGCRRDSPSNPANDAYATAINQYWAQNPSCMWPQPVRMPTQKDVKPDNSQQYDALTDIGFLERLQTTRKTFIFGNKQVSDYDLTPQGRSAWVADPSLPGYGNFCYGHRSVTNIDQNAMLVNDRTGVGQTPTAIVPYSYQIKDAAAWAMNPELQTAFPDLGKQVTQPNSDTATLVRTPQGWAMNPPVAVPQAGNARPNPAGDYGVVGQPNQQR